MRTSGLASNKRVAYYEYDFARHGGAIGAINVPGDVIPAGAIIKEGIIHVKTAVTATGSATLAIKALATDDIVAATAKASLTLNALLATVPVGTAGSSIRVTTRITQLVFTVAVDALLTGKVVVALEYVVTD